MNVVLYYNTLLSFFKHLKVKPDVFDTIQNLNVIRFL